MVGPQICFRLTPRLLAAQRLLTPRLDGRISPDAWGLLHGAPALTVAGLAPASSKQHLVGPRSPPSSGRTTIIFYNENVEIWKEELVAATRANKKDAYKYIADLPAVGATNIFDSLEKAFGIGKPSPGQVQDKRYSNAGDSPDTIFLLSDGAPNKGRITDPNAILVEIAKMNRLRRIVIHTIGIGKGENRPFMQGLAKQNRGTYVHRD